MTRKKIIGVVIFFVIIVALAIFGLEFSGGKNIWVCQSGQWVKDGNPMFPKPPTGCGETKIVVSYPQPQDIVKNPLVIEGIARGFWFFEAVFPACLYDDSGQKLGCNQMQAQSDWMTQDFVPFKGQIDFKLLAKNESGTLILQKDNPSGLPENADQIEIPVRFPSSEVVPVKMITVKAFFNNSKLAPFSCDEVFPVERELVETQAVGRAALEELLKGPTDAEKSNGFFTNINSGVTIQKLAIDENGVAKVDFDKQLEFQVGGSCRVAAIRAQINKTLEQFSTIKDVVISIDGRTEDILQP